MRRVAIVAAAQTRFRERRNDVRHKEMVYEIVKELLDRTGLKFIEGEGIDNTVTASDDYFDARTISSLSVEDVVGGHHRTEEKVAQDGAQAVFYAFAGILSGRYDITLVVAHCKESEVASPNMITNLGFDPFYQRPLGVDYVSAAALQACMYMHKYGISPEQCAMVAVKNLGNAKGNPFAQRALDLTVEDVLSSPLLASPIHNLEAKPVSDGACALILACEEKAKRITDKPIWIKGVGNCYDSYYLGDRDLADCKALTEAAKRAYRMAGISEPRREIDVAEVSEFFSYQELMWYEGLGFCGRGEGGKLLESGRTWKGGEIPVNPSGGVLSGNPYIVAGMVRIAEAFLQLRGEAGERQVEGARTALAHGITGPCGQFHTVFILGV